MNQVYIVVYDGSCDHCSCEKTAIDIIEVFEREIDAENYANSEEILNQYGYPLDVLTYLVK